jgi:predicted nucleotidyltransferase
MALTETSEPEDHLGMTDAQWAQWQEYTRGYGEQDANGVDVSLVRQNLCLTPWQRLGKMERQLGFFQEDGMEQTNDFQRIIETLNSAGLRFVIIGGIAMRLQGSSILTDDIDFAFARDPQNLEALVKALAPYHPYLRGTPPGLPFFWDVRSLKNMVNMTLTTDLGSIDLLGEPAGITSFENLWDDATAIIRGGIPVRVASIPSLIAMKRAAGRPKDRVHLMELERMQAEKESSQV